MPIFYSLLARGKIVLCDHAEVSGNFESLCQSILQTKRQEGSRISYSSGRYLFHVATIHQLTFVCVTEETFDRNIAYTFLMKVAEELKEKGLQDKANVCGPYALRLEFSSWLAKLMIDHSSNDRITQLSSQVKEVTDVMTRNIEQVVARGEALTDLEERSENLAHTSVQFRNSATKLRKKVFWKSVKLWVVVIAVFLIVLAIIVAIVVVGAMGKFGNKK